MRKSGGRVPEARGQDGGNLKHFSDKVAIVEDLVKASIGVQIA